MWPQDTKTPSQKFNILTCVEICRKSYLQSCLRVISCPGVRCGCPLSYVFSCWLREILMKEKESEGESMREGGMGNRERERERRGKTAACSYTAFYSSVNLIV